MSGDRLRPEDLISTVPGTPWVQEPRSTIQPEFITRVLEVARAIDGVLVAHHTLRSSLKAGPPLGAFERGTWRPTPLDVGVAHFGERPLFALWVECRAVEALRIAWTGKPSLEMPIAAPAPPEPKAAEPIPTVEGP